MKCMIECALASAFLGGSIWTMTANKNQKLYNMMDEKNKQAFMKIKKERMTIWLKASLLGLIFSLVYVHYIKEIDENSNVFSHSCMSVLVYFTVQYLFYTFHPKSDWMLNYIENKEQAKIWLDNYKEMKSKWHTGLVLGVIGYLFLCIFMFKNKVQEYDEYETPFMLPNNFNFPGMQSDYESQRIPNVIKILSRA